MKSGDTRAVCKTAASVIAVIWLGTI